MEWDSKVPSWDLTELDQNVEPSVSSIAGDSSEPIEPQLIGIDCSVDLKLGGLDEFRPPDKWKKHCNAVPMTSPFKRARSVSNSATCSVDGCKADLSHCREYHRRHKVCEVHSKTPFVMVGGQEQRFCQQCSRFHLLVEFDEVKRSCRKRLDGHNRRRRKLHPPSTDTRSLFASQQGERLSTYLHTLRIPIPETTRNGTVKVHNDTIYAHQQHLHFANVQTFAASFTPGYKRDKQHPFSSGIGSQGYVRESEAAFVKSPFEEPAYHQLKTVSSAETGSSRIFDNELTQVLDSGCALSLLSSSEGIPMGSNAVEEEQAGPVPVSDTDANLHCQIMFQSLPFSWQ